MFVVKCFYLIVPGAFANMAPVLFKKVNFLNYSVDMGKTWRGKPLFGAHKTYRGFFFAIIVSILIIYLQRWLFINYSFFRELSILPYSSLNPWLLGFFVGFGVMLGDMIESFFKRRVGIAPGKPWIPWDQLDCAIGGLAGLTVLYIPPIEVIVFLLVAIPLTHILLNHIGYYTGLTKSKW
jgi:CDP-2,3-bis-(O-geranylgeranyl)-sn-glycerol synthase